MNRRPKPAGIAVFLLMTAIVALSLLMKDLFLAASQQALRARNTSDRIEAIYLARTALALARFFLIFDQFENDKLSDGRPSDTFKDVWNSPIPFPISADLLSAAAQLGQQQDPSAEASPPAEETPEQKERAQKCQEFFKDFNGNAVATVEDLASRLNLNDLDQKDVFETLTDLLRPNASFVEDLSSRNIRPDEVAQQLRDFMDANDINDTTQQREEADYADLEIKPRNRPFSTLDEVKLIPLVDDELFEYLSQRVRGFYIPNAPKPSRVNLNTVSKDLFQALLRNVSDPQGLAEEFIQDREKNNRVYNDKEAGKILEEVLGLKPENYRANLIAGTSDLFEVRTESEVNNVKIEMIATIYRRKGSRLPNQIISLRIGP